MPEVPNAADFRNSSLTTSTKLQSCSDLEKAQHGLYQAAHLFYAASLLIPHHTFVWSIFISRILMGLAYALVTVWACLELCAPDVFAWNVLLTAGTLVHIVYWSWRFRPGRIRQKPLLELYQKLFLPLDCSRELFVQLTNKSVIRSLQVGDDFFLATRQLCSIPASSNPSASMRLSVLLTGKMRVTFGLGQRLLHHIEPFQFVDSPEWYMMQNVSPQDVKASKIQVSITADEPCTLLQLDAENLNHLTVNNPPLRFLLDCLIGKDVSQKLYAVTEQAALMVTSRDPSSKQDRLPSLQVGGGSSVGVNSTTTYSSLGPWQGELLRSQSADAVHTCKQGQVRSINWRRDQTRRIWARRYQKLVPTRHHRPLKKPAPCRQEMSRRGDHLGKEDPGDCGGGKVSSSPKYPTLEVGNRHEQIIRIEPHHQERLHWNRVQFDETFV
ncbi:blood vessel epicardial substance-like [Daphnia pulex]|uniref:blood vessel epicardial substance-like n=1 Tax=Daphnia pulex TaxID=6669 RepID=UPI001EDCE795|nr:blood vessel epicardial substance-like [Daphnia pulex]XP_046456219.1 blood vessel epicardial substance-like [Daphnia pulex]XP_046456220.1 blood vessel epicardial substance-like [Daphnia pulex]XP_046456221.1 blood vessel epicardial substance-like [Daphnia pulex]XP_046456223.1 blood vessel epicardial substance-like [Daphnia pulex]